MIRGGKIAHDSRYVSHTSDGSLGPIGVTHCTKHVSA